MFFKLIAKNLFWEKNLLDDLLRVDLKYLYSTPSRFGKQYFYSTPSRFLGQYLYSTPSRFVILGHNPDSKWPMDGNR